MIRSWKTEEMVLRQLNYDRGIIVAWTHRQQIDVARGIYRLVLFQGDDRGKHNSITDHEQNHNVGPQSFDLLLNDLVL